MQANAHSISSSISACPQQEWRISFRCDLVVVPTKNHLLNVSTNLTNCFLASAADKWAPAVRVVAPPIP